MEEEITGEEILFKEETNFKTGMWFQPPVDKLFLYSQGYKCAAEILWKSCMEDSSKNNILGYPLLFLYRHYLELQLKELIFIGKGLAYEVEEFDDDHSLEKLWKTYKTEVLPKLNNTLSKDVLNNIEKILYQLHSEDNNSFAFRYPVNTKKKGRLKSITRHSVDLKNFREVIDKLIFFLEGQRDMMYAIETGRSAMHDAMADYYNEYQ